ncbi:MAG: AAA family ATPase [Sphaerospermopsis sp.]|nr:AAA family ATPase [Sphaerospermopsis sp.]
MHIQRIQVPDFRALKNVDITFEKEFTPRIFPLGSQNGGGKSTLLQLIFVLLHCAGNPDRVEFIQNLLHDFYVKDKSGKRTLAIIDIWDGSKTVTLDFFVCNKKFISELLESEYEINIHPRIKYTIHDSIQNTEKNINNLNYKKKYLSGIIDTLNKMKENATYVYAKKEHIERISKEMNTIKRYILDLGISINDRLDYFNIMNPTENNVSDLLSIIEETIEEYKKKIDEMYIELEHLEDLLEKFLNSLGKCKTLYLCDFPTRQDNNFESEVLLCQADNDNEVVKKLLTELSENIFLSAHISQVFLFLPSETRKLLLKGQSNEDNYYLELQDKKSALPGLFTYDFLAVDTIIESFKDARDKDFKQAIETGEYGNNYKTLMNELYAILSNKKVNIDSDFSGINFKLDSDGTELYPEDLSHGELKRLCIYTWMKHNKIRDAIVLMDELEISFHPDWQYQIVRDLEEWGATNQYILATHSYEICQAVTPAHVKELEPKLSSKTIQ